MLFQLQRGLSTLPRLVRPAISSKRLISTTRPNLRNRGEGFLYNTFFKYSSRYIVFIFVGAAFGELFYNGFWEMVWNTNNKGVTFILNNYMF